jgi:hypothetical protein
MESRASHKDAHTCPSPAPIAQRHRLPDAAARRGIDRYGQWPAGAARLRHADLADLVLHHWAVILGLAWWLLTARGDRVF